MSSQAKVEALRDNISSAQALIDQARAHYAEHKRLFSKEMCERFERDLEERQKMLDFAKKVSDREFPR